MFRILASLTTLICLGVAGYIQGRFSEALEGSESLREAVGRVETVDLDLGEWKGTPLETDDQSFAQAGAQKYWMRNYVNSRTGATVMVILMAGPAKRMAVHTPEVCYRGAGFQLTDGPHKFVAEDGRHKDEFWTGRFRKQGLTPTDLKLFWAWSVEGRWQAPNVARSEFAAQPFLYKLYVSQETTGALSSAKNYDAPARELLKVLLPELDRKLYRLAATR